MSSVFRLGSVLLFSILLLASVQLIQEDRVAYADSVTDDLICQIFEHLQSQGLPIPPGLDASGCEGEEGGELPTPGVTQCSNFIDDDGDSLIDFLPGNELGDPDCASSFDDSEAPEVDDPEDPVDVCPNIDGNQETVPEGMEIVEGDCVAVDGEGEGEDEGGDDGDGGEETGGGSTDSSPTSSGGGGVSVCRDSSDNDSDGLVDAADPGCLNEFDGDESNPVTLAVSEETAEGASEGGEEESAEEPIACDAYVTSFMRLGAENDSAQVTRLQKILISPEGLNVEENGIFDEKTRDAVRAFQTRYSSEILSPWGITEPTGFVYLTTRKKINELYCNAQFPLSPEEQSEIEAFRNQTDDAESVVVEGALESFGPNAPDSTHPVEVVPTVGEAETEVESQVAAVGEAIDETDERGVWSPIRDFLSRIFNRGN